MNCEFVYDKSTIEKSISASTKEEFVTQFRSLLECAKEPRGIAYIWKTQSSIPRLKGESPIIYIGKTVRSFYSRYRPEVVNEANNFWDRYSYIICNYGNISIELYSTTEPNKTESRLLYQYHREFMELPPLNLRSYNLSML